jgi:hypothetical protein
MSQLPRFLQTVDGWLLTRRPEAWAARPSYVILASVVGLAITYLFWNVAGFHHLRSQIVQLLTSIEAVVGFEVTATQPYAARRLFLGLCLITILSTISWASRQVAYSDVFRYGKGWPVWAWIPLNIACLISIDFCRSRRAGFRIQALLPRLSRWQAVYCFLRS